MKKNLLSFSILTLVLIGFMGCLNYEQKVKLNADGSGSIKIHYWTKESNVAMIPKLSFDESELKTNQYAPEIVKSAKSELDNKDSTKHVNVEFDFKDINKLDQTKGFKDNIIKLEEKSGLMVLTHTIKKDSSANTFGMDQYTLKYEYEFPAKPENVDANGKAEGNVVKWEFKYSELGNRDIVMTAGFKNSKAFPLTTILIIVGGLIIIGIVVFVITRKKPAPTTA